MFQGPLSSVEVLDWVLAIERVARSTIHLPLCLKSSHGSHWEIYVVEGTRSYEREV